MREGARLRQKPEVVCGEHRLAIEPEELARVVAHLRSEIARAAAG